MIKGFTFFHWSRRGLPGDKKIKSAAVMAGLIWSFSVTLGVFVVLGLWVLMTRGVEYHLTGVLAAATLLGALLGGFVSGMSAGRLGWLHGAVTSIIYGILLLLFTRAGGPEAFTGLTAAGQIAAYGITGAAGGVTGVNISMRGEKRKTPGRMLY